MELEQYFTHFSLKLQLCSKTDTIDKGSKQLIFSICHIMGECILHLCTNLWLKIQNTNGHKSNLINSTSQNRRLTAQQITYKIGHEEHPRLHLLTNS